MRILKICLDPGHGGKFNNAQGNGLIEKSVVLEYAGLVRARLEYLGHEVLLTRDIDMHLDENLDRDLLARAEIANNWGADVFISLHCNGFKDPSANGFEVWTSPGETKSDHLAQEIIEEFAFEFPTVKIRKDMSDGDGDKEAKFVVLTKTDMSAALIEIGFLTNVNDATRIKSVQGKQGFVNSVCNAVQVFNKEWLS